MCSNPLKEKSTLSIRSIDLSFIEISASPALSKAQWSCFLPSPIFNKAKYYPKNNSSQSSQEAIDLIHAKNETNLHSLCLRNHNLLPVLLKLASEGRLLFNNKPLYADFSSSWKARAILSSAQGPLEFEFFRPHAKKPAQEHLIEISDIDIWLWGRENGFISQGFIHLCPEQWDKLTYQELMKTNVATLKTWSLEPSLFQKEYDFEMIALFEPELKPELKLEPVSTLTTTKKTIPYKLILSTYLPQEETGLTLEFQYGEDKDHNRVSYKDLSSKLSWRDSQWEEKMAQDLISLGFVFNGKSFVLPENTLSQLNELLIFLVEMGWSIENNIGQTLIWTQALSIDSKKEDQALDFDLFTSMKFSFFLRGEYKVLSLIKYVEELAYSRSIKLPIKLEKNKSNVHEISLLPVSPPDLIHLAKLGIWMIKEGATQPNITQQDSAPLINKKARLSGALKFSLEETLFPSTNSNYLHQATEIKALYFEEYKNNFLPNDLSLLEGKLRSYQLQAVEWILTLWKGGSGALLADEMGLGKTVIACGLIAYLAKKESPKKILIIVPASLISQWHHQLKTFVPSIQTLIYHGKDRQIDRENNSSYSDQPQVFITSYHTLYCDREKMALIDWDLVILDEAQVIKNVASLICKACHQLNAIKKLALSATPVENQVSEIWSIISFLNPNWLGSYQSFTKKSSDLNLFPLIKKSLSPLMLRRLKKDVAKDLPEKIEIEKRLNFSDREDLLYKEALSAIKNNKNLHPFQALMKLRQLALSPALVDPSYNFLSTKEEFLKSHLTTELKLNQNILVFSHFSQFIHRLKNILSEDTDQILLLDGGTSAQKRKEAISYFQNPQSKPTIFLMTMQAAGVGLDLSRADQVILCDPWWNKSKENQAIDRAHRIGRHADVTALRLITAGSIEEKMLKLQNDKESLTHIWEKETLSSSLSMQALWQLLDS